ncbi:MAG: peptide deformylase [Thermoguttaceae bacterium]
MNILKYPHPTLRHKSKALRRVDSELRKLVRQMFDIMYEREGIGLAANQVDLPYRLFILNLAGDPEAKDEEHVFINPVITQPKGSVVDKEGCLSFPEIFAPVRRSAKVVLAAYTLEGKEIAYELDGLFARAAQHESDHLDGVLFVDRLTPSHLLSIREDLAALEREFLSDRQRGVIGDDDQIVARLLELETART